MFSMDEKYISPVGNPPWWYSTNDNTHQVSGTYPAITLGFVYENGATTIPEVGV